MDMVEIEAAYQLTKDVLLEALRECQSEVREEMKET